MSRNSFIFIVTLITIAVVGTGIWFFSFYQGGGEGDDVEISIADFISFGTDTAPFGDEGETIDDETPGGGENSSISTGVRAGRLVELSPAPIAGFLPRGTSTPSVRFVERATGHIYDINADGKERKRVVNTTVPRIYEAEFGDGGTSVVLRYLRDDTVIETYTATIAAGEGGGELKGTFLPQDVKDISISPDGKKFFYVLKLENGANGFTALMSGASRTQVFTSFLSEWLSRWQTDRFVYLTTKPSGGMPGYLYRLDTSTKSLEKVLGGIPGLTALPDPTGRFIVFGAAGERGGVSIYFYDILSKKTEALNVATLPEKCVWENDGETLFCGVPEQVAIDTYPDAWYQGRTTFSDRLWKIEIFGTLTTVAADLERLSGKEIDVIKPALSENEEFLYFMNKKDGSLWSYKLDS